MKVISGFKSSLVNKMLLIAFILFASFASLYAVDENNIFSIPVTFTANTGINVGFSDKKIDTVLKYTSALDQIVFDIDSTDNVLRTGTFYFYVQSYVTNRIKVTVADIGPLKGNSNNEELKWINEGESLNTIKDSSSASVVVIDEASNAPDLTKPRVYNVGMDFTIPLADLIGKASTEYMATLRFKVETV